jgi:Domain of unknown function (DUF4357)
MPRTWTTSSTSSRSSSLCWAWMRSGREPVAVPAARQDQLVSGLPPRQPEARRRRTCAADRRRVHHARWLHVVADWHGVGKADSTIRAYQSYRAQHQKLLADGSITVAGGIGTLTKDVVFGSPSTAGAIAQGRSCNGRTSWMADDGSNSGAWESRESTDGQHPPPVDAGPMARPWRDRPWDQSLFLCNDPLETPRASCWPTSARSAPIFTRRRTPVRRPTRSTAAGCRAGASDQPSCRRWATRSRRPTPAASTLPSRARCTTRS